MTDPKHTEPCVEVTEADEERADALDNDLVFLMKNERAILLERLAAHRTAAEAASRKEADRAWSAYKIAHDQATANGAELAASRQEVERLRHIATDLLQHVDWLTCGLPGLLESGGLTDEDGLIGAAIDSANSARAALSPTATEGEW